jgi:hypothetical protein
MKVSTTDVPRLAGVILRACATNFRLHETCAIRKCRRDGGCTGPMLRCEADGSGFVPALSSDDPEECAPFCCLALPGPVRQQVAGMQQRAVQQVAGRPGHVYPEETRAIAARSWAGAFFAAEPVPEA